ncbi:ribonuclease H-like domain-containing protein [Tanacetum coccineum]
MKDFQECVDSIGVYDVNCTGLRYTWNQKPKGGDGILKKIDRIMANSEFYNVFVGSNAYFQPYQISDDTPAVLHGESNIHDNVVKLRHDLDVAQTALDSDPNNLVLQEEEASYLHAYTDGLNRIDCITNSNGLSIDGEQVPMAFVDHYTEFLGQQGITTTFDTENLFCNTLSEDIANHMVREVTDQEIRKAMFSIGDNKAPGPDGYSAAFFKEAWNIVGTDVTKAIKEFFTNGVLLKELNHTIIALIPKGALNELVNINQSAFVPGRRISDNILLTQELMHNYHLDRGVPRCAFKVDIQKAYDTVDWNFLRAVLIGFGFHHRMIGWIMECVTSTSFSISINGCLHGYFKGKRGLRQGDPLSPYLFTLVMEVLTLMLHRRARVTNSFTYHRYCSKLNIINLCFADDLFLFAHGDVDSARIGILVVLPFEEEKLPVKYLGVPLVPSRFVYRDCAELVERVKRRISDWKNKFLSFAGRAQLVRSVLSSMHIYWASMFILPSSLILELEQLMRGFLWCQGEMKKGKAKVAWEVVCLPKNESMVALVVLCSLGPLSSVVSNRDIYSARFHLNAKVSEITMLNAWKWPDSWYVKYPLLSTVPAPNFSDALNRVYLTNWSNVDVEFSVAEVWEALRPRNYEDVSSNHNLASLVSPLCESQPDSHDHLFFGCRVSSWIWDQLNPYMCILNLPPALNDIVEFLIPFAKMKSIRIVICKLVFAVACYFIWQERNFRIFKKRKERKVHLSQLGPLCLNKVITFEVLCRSLQIEPTVTLFRVFQTLYKQGDWFSFAKCRAPSLVCIDDNRSCMKHWNSGLFFIDRRAISHAMVWRHPDAAIDNPRPVAGSFNMADVHRLSAYVIKLRDMPEGVLVLSGLSIHDFLYLPEWTGAEVQEEPHLDVRSTLQRLPFYSTPLAAADAVIPDPTPEDLAVGTPSSKIVAKAEASQKRKASTSGATSSHVAKCTRSALAQSSGSTTRPSLFVGDDDESDDDNDDACVEIPLVTPFHSTDAIPSSGNQGGSSTTPTAEDSRGKGVMVDDAAAPSAGATRPRPSSGPAPSFRNVFGDAIHTDFFPFSAGPYYATYPEDSVAGNCEFTREEWDAPYWPTFGVLTKKVFKDLAVCKIIVDQFPTPGKMVQVESLSDNQLAAKMSVLHCMMMSHSGELLARYHRLNQSHHEYVLSTDFRLKGYEEKVASLFGLELQVSALKKQVSGLNDKLSSSDASFAKSKAKGKERKKKIKSLTKSVDNLHSEMARLSVALNQATVLKAEKDEEILRLKATPSEFSSFFCGQFQGLVRKFLAYDKFNRVQGELLSLAASAWFERGLSMHQTKDEFADVLKKMANFLPGAHDRLAKASPLEARVSPPIKESTVTPASKSLELSANVNFTASAVALEHNEEMVNAEVDGSGLKMIVDTAAVKSRHAFMQDISVALDDVVELVEKGDGLDSSSAAGEEATTNPSGV